MTGPSGAGLRVAVIGLGRAGEKHAMVYDKIPFVELAAVCDTNRERLARVSKRVNAEAYESYDSLLRDDSIEAVSIVMPDTLHYEVTRAAIEAGKHILLEKPIAATVPDAAAICELAASSDRVLLIGHILRFMAAHRIAQARISSGELGEIIHLSARRNSTIAGARAYSSHRTDTHIHLLIHDIDYVNWVVDSRPRSVYAKSRRVLLAEYGMRDSILAIVEYENGTVASLEGCWVLPESSPIELDDRMEIVGTKGVIYLDGICRGIEMVSDRGSVRPDTVAWPDLDGHPGGALFEEITHFVGCIQTGTPPLVGPDEAFQALKVADAIDRSITERKEIIFD